MDILKAGNWPFGVHVLRMGLAALVTAAFGAHAWALARRGEGWPVAFRWVFGLYSLAFFFLAWANFVMMIVTAYSRSYKPGPFHVGTFTLLAVAAYFFTASYRPYRASS